MSPSDLIADLPLSRHTPYTPRTYQSRTTPTKGAGEPLGVQTTYGDVLLYPNGYATLNGAPWTEQPVKEWCRLDDGRLAVTLAGPADNSAPQVGFVADTRTHVGILRTFQPSREDKALLPVRLAAALTHRLRTLRGSQTMFTVDLGDLSYQAASLQGDAVLIEITGDEFLPDHRRLTAAHHQQLLRRGFTRPDADLPNWWIGIENGSDRGLFAAARAVISALVEVHGVSTEDLTTELPLYRYSPYPPRTLQPRPLPTEGEGQPLGVQTTYGDVLLYPNGYATLNGVPWAERPVMEWIRLDDGRLSIQLAIPSDDHFPNIGFVADTPDHVAVLRGFLPSRADQTDLALRLAVAEHYALTCIATGTMYHERLFRASLALERAEGAVRASEVVGWEHAARLAAADEAISAFYGSHGADNAGELYDDQERTWDAIQTWVRLSPWRVDFDFDIIPSSPHPFAIAGPEVEIQRLY